MSDSSGRLDETRVIPDSERAGHCAAFAGETMDLPPTGWSEERSQKRAVREAAVIETRVAEDSVEPGTSLVAAASNRLPPEHAETIDGTAAEIVSPAIAAGAEQDASATMVETEPPDVFGRYRIQSLLGRGAMGSVYLALDTQLDRKVALKVPEFRHAGNETVIQRFYREARSAATLQHPNICPVFDVGEHDGQHFISMGFIDGRPLSDYVESGKQQSERQVAAVIRKLALALNEAHDRGIIHRDLKPANIMIDRRGEPVVMDFGLARQAETPEDAKITREGTLVGSPAYMSPEQVRGRDIGPASDIYSLGVVLFELLTNRTPFHGTVGTVISQIINDPTPDPSSLRPGLSPELSAICMKAMAHSVGERFPTMKSLADALSAFIKGDKGAIQSMVGLEPPPSGTSRDHMLARRTEAEGLLRRGAYRTAVSVLEELATTENAPEESVKTWAEAQLPEARARLEQTLDESRSLYRRAKKSLSNNDYERATQLLDQIPEDIESPAIRDLKAEARELADEVAGLSEQVSLAITSGRRDDILPVVERLLELKPGHRQANDLYRMILDGVSTRSTEADAAAPVATVTRSSRSGQRSRSSRQSRMDNFGLTPQQWYVVAGTIVGVFLLIIAIDQLLSGGGNSPATAVIADAVAQQPVVVAEPASPPRLEVRSAETGAEDASVAVAAAADTNDGPALMTVADALDDQPAPPDEFDPADRRPFDDRPDGPFDGPRPRIQDFEFFDRNEDGVLDPNEAPPHLLDVADTDFDDRITRSELAEALRLHGPTIFRRPDGRGPRPGPGPGGRGNFVPR